MATYIVQVIEEQPEAAGGCGCLLLGVMVIALGLNVFDSTTRWFGSDFVTTTSVQPHETASPAATGKATLEAGENLVCIKDASDECVVADTPSGRWVHVELGVFKGNGWLPLMSLAFDHPWYRDAVSWLIAPESATSIDERVRRKQRASLTASIRQAFRARDVDKLSKWTQIAADHAVALEPELTRGIESLGLGCAKTLARISSLTFLETEKLEAATASCGKQCGPCKSKLTLAVADAQSKHHGEIVASWTKKTPITDDWMVRNCLLAKRAHPVDKQRFTRDVYAHLRHVARQCRKGRNDAIEAGRALQGADCRTLVGLLTKKRGHNKRLAAIAARCK